MDTRVIEAKVKHAIQESPKLSPMLFRTSARGRYPDLQPFAVMGLNEEAGEVAGLACRECYKCVDMPCEKWLEELGDVLWYLTAAIIARGFTFDEVWAYNVDKLEDRYGKCREKET